MCGTARTTILLRLQIVNVHTRVWMPLSPRNHLTWLLYPGFCVVSSCARVVFSRLWLLLGLDAVDGRAGLQAMKYMMDTDDLANKLRSFTLVAVVVKVRAVQHCSRSCLCVRFEAPPPSAVGVLSVEC